MHESAYLFYLDTALDYQCAEHMHNTWAET